jgi:hypothetical protein
VYRSGRLFVLTLLSIAAMLGPLGCGDDDSGDGTSYTGSDAAPEPTHDPGCTDEIPNRVGATDSGYDGWLTLCVTDDRDVVRVKNRSGNTFFVWSTNQDTSLEVTEAPSTKTFAGYLASQAVPPGDPDENGYWMLTPDATIVATNEYYEPAAVKFQISPENTAAYNAGHSSGAYVDRLAVSRSQALVNKGLACANSASNAAGDQSRLDLALDAVTVRSACKGFLDDALKRDAQAVDDTEGAWRKVLNSAKRLAGGSWDDELAYGIARFARH